MSEFLQIVGEINPFLLNALSFLVGLLAGHRIELMRDKRKEFNAAVEPHRFEILRRGANARLPDAADIDRFEWLMYPWQRKRLRLAIRRANECREANQRRDTYGGLIIENAAEVEAALHRVLALLRPR